LNVFLDLRRLSLADIDDLCSRVMRMPASRGDAAVYHVEAATMPAFEVEKSRAPRCPITFSTNLRIEHAVTSPCVQVVEHSYMIV